MIGLASPNTGGIKIINQHIQSRLPMNEIITWAKSINQVKDKSGIEIVIISALLKCDAKKWPNFTTKKRLVELTVLFMRPIAHPCLDSGTALPIS